MKIILLTVLVALSSCSVRPQRYFGVKASGAKMDPPVGSANTEEEVIEPIDTYLNIGPFLQKELDKIDNPAKIVKVFVLMRQETIVSKNFDLLKASLVPVNPAISSAIELAQKNSFSTVEIDVEIGTLKTALTFIPKAVSSIEMSLGSVNEK